MTLVAVLQARDSLEKRIPLLIKIAPDLILAEMEDIAEVALHLDSVYLFWVMLNYKEIKYTLISLLSCVGGHIPWDPDRRSDCFQHNNIKGGAYWGFQGGDRGAQWGATDWEKHKGGLTDFLLFWNND